MQHLIDPIMHTTDSPTSYSCSVVWCICNSSNATELALFQIDANFYSLSPEILEGFYVLPLEPRNNPSLKAAVHVLAEFCHAMYGGSVP